LVVEEVEDERLHLERVAALDIGKAGLEACIRAPGKSNPARRAQEVRSFGPTKAEILVLAAWLHEILVLAAWLHEHLANTTMMASSNL
jgi:hypothetical protein